MILKDDFQLENTRRLLAKVSARYKRLDDDTSEDPRLRRLTMRSLKKLMNQLTEEIIRYNCRHAATQTQTASTE